MKKVFFIISLITIAFGCTQVVDISLDTDNPKLVVEANINWQKGTDGKNQTIKLTTTTNFYTNIIPIVQGASVLIINTQTNQEFSFEEEEIKGLYRCNNFIPILNNNYTLKIFYNGINYTASEKLVPVSPISEIIQEEVTGFNGVDIRVKTIFVDPIETTDFYLFNYVFKDNEDLKKPIFYVSKDTFYNGNPFFSGTFRSGIRINNVIAITHFGISQNYYNYLSILLRLSNQNGNPFSAPPVGVRGNISNLNDDNNFPFGYFSLSESDTKDYIVK